LDNCDDYYDATTLNGEATYVKVREAGRIVSVAVIIAVAVNTDGVREVLGMAVGLLEAEPFGRASCARSRAAGCVG